MAHKDQFIDFLKIDDLTFIRNIDPKFEVRAVKSEPNETIPMHYHDDIEFHCQLKGNITHIIDDNEYHLEQGELVIINRKLPHCNLPITEDDINLVVIVSHRFLNNLIIESGFDHQIINLKNLLLSNNFEFKYSLTPKLTSLLEDMLENTKDYHPVSPFKQRILITLFIMELTNLNFIIQDTSKDGFLDLVSYINENIKDASLSDYADKVNYSSSYVSRRIKEDYEASFMEILIEIRMQKAARRLISTNDKIENIMYQIGYTNKTHFYELFKSRYNQTPSSYRKQNK